MRARSIHLTVLLVGALLLAGPSPVDGAELRLSLPVECQPGKDCWIINYLDHDKGPGVRDFACGPRTYDGHRGTDIALGDRAAMRAGVKVLTAAPGRVIGVRDGAADAPEGESIDEERACGNGVRIDHGDGWITQYCHMKQSSIAVSLGEEVAGGQALGQVGLSGRTEFPHLHFQVEKDGVRLDPFVGAQGGRPCGLGDAPLWRPEVLTVLTYRPAVLYNAGFASEAPRNVKIIEGLYRQESFATKVPALVFWMEALGVRVGDRLTLRLEGPEGTIAESHDTLVKDQARRWAFVGRKRPGAAWPVGLYRGEAVLRRETAGGPLSWRISRHVEIR
jgi:hypothetical protein